MIDCVIHLSRAWSVRGAILASLLVVAYGCEPKSPKALGERDPRPHASGQSSTSGGGAIRPVGPGEIPGGRNEPCDPAPGARAYEVGPDKPWKTLGDVSWLKLKPGDVVRIHAKPEPYREKLLLSASGTATQPIRICGIADAAGKRPVLDAKDAVAVKGVPYPYPGTQDRGLVVVSLSQGQTYGYKPSHLIIQGLELRGAHPDAEFTGFQGDRRRYQGNAAAVFLERGENVIVRDCIMRESGNGFFVASGDDEARLSRSITLENSAVYDNGVTGAEANRRHNIYTEAVDMVIQGNRIGPTRDGSEGSALKDRSTRPVVRYNWIEGGARQLDLVEAEDSLPMVKDLPGYHDAFVYGNVIISHDKSASNVVHWGGDNGMLDRYKTGTLYFYANTVIVEADRDKRWRTSLFQLETNDQTLDLRNNVFFAMPTHPGGVATEVSLMNEFGKAIVGKNVAGPKLMEHADNREFRGTIQGFDGLSKITASPFADLTQWNLAPAADGPLVGGASALATNALPVDKAYVKHLGLAPRSVADVGALEH